MTFPPGRRPSTAMSDSASVPRTAPSARFAGHTADTDRFPRPASRRTAPLRRLALAAAAPLATAACVDPVSLASAAAVTALGTAAVVSTAGDLAVGETVPTGAYGRRQILERDDGVSVVAVQGTIRRADRNVIRAARSALVVPSGGIDGAALAGLAADACGLGLVPSAADPGSEGGGAGTPQHGGDRPSAEGAGELARRHQADLAVVLRAFGEERRLSWSLQWVTLSHVTVEIVAPSPPRVLWTELHQISVPQSLGEAGRPAFVEALAQGLSRRLCELRAPPDAEGAPPPAQANGRAPAAPTR